MNMATYRNLAHRPARPALNRGRVQVACRRALLALGRAGSTSEVIAWTCARTRTAGRPGSMTKLMSKSELIQKVADQHSLSKKDVKGVIESLASVGYKELKKNGAFLLPGFAKFVVIKKPAMKERAGINPFTKEPTVFKAKPARKIVRARPVKAAKDAV
jgi:DNA-binding protein HU-beta